MRRLFLFFACVLSLWGPLWPAGAQGASGTLQITHIDTQAFPQISTYVTANDASGKPIPGLPDGTFALQQDGQPVSGLEVAEIDVGAQIVFVLDSSPAYKERDANGRLRLEHLTEALNSFFRDKPWMKDSVDDITLVAPEGVIIAHSHNGVELFTALRAYTTTFAGVADTFPLISQAIDIAAETPPRAGMRPSVVVLSSGIKPVAAKDLAARAQAERIAVYTVFAGWDEAEVAPALQQLAELTGAAYYNFDNKPANLEPLFQRLAESRAQYRLTYRAAIAATGQYRLQAGATLTTGATLVSDEVGFPVRVEPPSVQFGSFPLKITRASPQAVEAPETVLPTEQVIPILLDFPDGHKRAVREAQLLVDGMPLDIQRAEAVGSLTWPLAGYNQNGLFTHTLQISLTDELGLSVLSPQVVAQVTVDIPAMPTIQKVIGRGGQGLVALVILGLLLIVGVGAWLWLVRGQQLTASAELDITQPTSAIRPESVTQPHLPRPARRVPRPALHLPPLVAKKTEQPSLKAYLEVVETDEGDPTVKNAPRKIAVTQSGLRLGRDPAQTDLTFTDRSVSRLHARIEVLSDEKFFIYDEHSTSGTWVNYTQVTDNGGHELKTGDLINLGRVQLRFHRRETSPNGGINEPPIKVIRTGSSETEAEDAPPEFTQPHDPVRAEH